MGNVHKVGHWHIDSMMLFLQHEMKMDRPDMRKIVRDVVMSCKSCGLHNRGKQVYQPPKGPQMVKPFEYVHLDLMDMDKSTEGYSAVLVVIDYMSRYVSLKPLFTKEKVEVAKALLDCFLAFGFPRTIKSDNGGEFVNSLLKIMVENLGIEHAKVVAYDHHSNGLVERCIGTARVMLQTFRDNLVDKRQWAQLIPLVQFGMNCRVNAITKRTPHFLMFGRNPFYYNGKMSNLFGEESAEQREEFWQAFMKAIPQDIYDLRESKFLNTRYPHLIGEFVVGEHVLKRKNVREGKHDVVFEPGTYEIVELLSNGNYLVKQGDTVIEQPANMLKRSNYFEPVGERADTLLMEKKVDFIGDSFSGKSTSKLADIPAAKSVNDSMEIDVEASNSDDEDYSKVLEERRRKHREVPAANSKRKRTSKEIAVSKDEVGQDDYADKSYDSVRQNGRGRSGRGRNKKK